jgi:hypothetical protein
VAHLHTTLAALADAYYPAAAALTPRDAALDALVRTWTRKACPRHAIAQGLLVA